MYPWGELAHCAPSGLRDLLCPHSPGRCPGLSHRAPLGQVLDRMPLALNLRPIRVRDYIKSGKCPWLSPSFSMSTSILSNIDSHKLLIGVSLGKAK